MDQDLAGGISRVIRSYSQENKEMAPLLALYGDLLEIKFHYLKKIPPLFRLSHREVEQSFQEGKFLLENDFLTVDPGLYKEILQAVASLLIKESKGEVARHLLQRIKEKRFNAEELTNQARKLCGKEGDILIPKTGGEEADKTREVDAFVLYMSFSPFFMRYAGEVKEKTGYSLWQEGYCPVCGQSPFMAKLREDDGARLLECDLCFTQWIFPRLRCPFCKNTDQKTLQFFYIPEQEAYRVHVCEVCHAYLKTVNAQKLKREAILGVENLVTLHLDILAQQEGYQGGLFPLPVSSWNNDFNFNNKEVKNKDGSFSKDIS